MRTALYNLAAALKPARPQRYRMDDMDARAAVIDFG